MTAQQIWTVFKLPKVIHRSTFKAVRTFHTESLDIIGASFEQIQLISHSFQLHV